MSKLKIESIAQKYETSTNEILSIGEADRYNFRKLINKQFSDISKIIHFDFVDYKPYPYTIIKDLIGDFRNGIVKVNVCGNDSELWGGFYNLQFRAIHDYIHCIHELDFNFADEVIANAHQYEFSLAYAKEFPHYDWSLYRKILRSEVVYQAAVKEHFNPFTIEQKIVLIDLLSTT
jgi:hypothetical protein